jgi:hypothetical protein
LRERERENAWNEFGLLSRQIDTFGSNFFIFFLSSQFKRDDEHVDFVQMLNLIDVVRGVFGVQAPVFVSRRNRMILFGLGIAHHEEDGELECEVLLHPKERIIHATNVGLGITKDLQTVEKISKFRRSDDEHYSCCFVGGSFISVLIAASVRFSFLITTIVKQRILSFWRWGKSVVRIPFLIWKAMENR